MTTTVRARAAITVSLVAILFGVLLAAVPATAAGAAGAVQSEVAVPAADSPSPTVGSTESPNPNPPGDPDSDPADFNDAIWVVVAVAGAALLISVTTLFWLRDRGTWKR